MTDYRVQLKVRNARLLRAIEAVGQKPGPKFAEVVGISYTCHLLPYLNLTRAPFDAAGNLRPCAEKLCLYFNRLPGDLWAPEQCEPLVHNSGEVELTAAGVAQLLLPDHDTDPARAIEQEQTANAVQAVVDRLPRRMGEVLKLRYGIGGAALTLQETAKVLNVTAEGVRRLEFQALRHLRRHAETVRIAREHFNREF